MLTKLMFHRGTQQAQSKTPLAWEQAQTLTRRDVDFKALCPKPPNVLPICLWRGLHHQLAVASTARNKEATDLLVINRKRMLDSFPR